MQNQESGRGPGQFFMASVAANAVTGGGTDGKLALAEIPPFPTVALRALNILAGTETSLRDLCEIVRPDAVFSAEILRLANSPLIAFSKEINNVLQASMLLGFRRLRRLVITVGLRSYLDQAAAELLRPTWRHSLACALVAERVAKWSSVDREFAFTCGILHDIGRVVLATIDPEQYSALLNYKADNPAQLIAMEHDTFEMDHCQAGKWLVGAWQLPAEFSEVIENHHAPLTHRDDAPELIRVSCLLSEGLGFPTTTNCSARNMEDTRAELPQVIREIMPDPGAWSQEINREIAMIEGYTNR